MPTNALAVRRRTPILQRAGGWATMVVAAVWLALGLSACSWDDDDDEHSDASPIALTVVADRATVNWNAPSEIDVLANDRVSRGSFILAAVGEPEHGRAQVAGGKLVYHPQPGYIGTDRVTYAVRAEEGAAVAEGRVDLVVHAELVLLGQAVVDVPLGGAQVRVRIGQAQHEAVADAQGRWRLPVVVDEPAAMVRIEALGRGAQAQVRLVSQVGHAAALLAAASKDGKVVAAELTATHLSTAQAAMVERLLGRPPISQAEWLSARARLFGYGVLSLGETLERVAEGSWPLPADVADTWELARRGGGPRAPAWQTLADAAALPLPLQPLPQRWLVSADLFGCNFETELEQNTVVCLNAVDLELRADGRATVIDTQGRRAAGWREEDGRLTVTYDHPVRYARRGLWRHPVTGESVPAAYDDIGFVLRMPLQGHVRMSSISQRVYLDGSAEPYAEPNSGPDDTGALMRLVTERGGTVLAADDFAADRRWAGIVGGDGSADVLRVVASGRAVAERSGTVFDLAVDGATLSLRGDDGSVRDYLRVSAADDLEVQHWVMYDRGGPMTVRPLVLVALEAQLSMSAADFVRGWEAHLRVPESDYQHNVHLFADGKARTYDDDFVIEKTWQRDSSGSATIANARSSDVSFERWQPLRRVGNTLFMLTSSATAQVGTAPRFEIWSLRAFDDLGPPSERTGL